MDVKSRKRSRNGQTQAVFLDQLASTCSVAASAGAAGLDLAAVYRMRRHDAAFAEEWDRALTLGYQMMETLLVGHALAGDGKPVFDIDLALKLLATRRSGATGRPVRAATVPAISEATSDETDRAILKRLAVIEKKRTSKAADAIARVEQPGHDG
ncbi:MAG: hypothetical protein WC816_07750 [Sphingomonas sp.]|jgi:hypothetical protein